MAIPLAYNLRNLAVRKTTTLMTALGIALTVAILVAVLALLEGLQLAFAATGHPLNILVMRRSATSELVSAVTRTSYQDLKLKAGIARTPAGEPMVSHEMVTAVAMENVENPDSSGMNLNVRGLLPIGLQMRDGLKIVAGRWFETGKREVVVGKSVAARYPGAALGKRVLLGRGEWTVVGVMDGGQSAVNGEIFGDLNQLCADYNRSEAPSSVLIRAADAVSMKALINDLESDRRLNVTAVSERSYYDQQTASAAPIQYLGIFVSVIMAIGSSFAAMNTMYAAVARRSAEIGTLRVLGFSRGGILFSFLVESLLLSLLGGVIGCLLVLPLNNVTTGIGSFVTFAEIAFNFHVGPTIMLTGIGFALLLGGLGGFFPARMAAKKEILSAFRSV